MMKINSKTRSIILYFYHKMFTGQPAIYKDVTIPLKVKHGLRQYKLRTFLFIEQNKHKSTPWAKLAKKGHMIMWVISLPDNKFLYQVVDGRINTLKDYKTSPWRKKIVVLKKIQSLLSPKKTK